jgi:hypothetical protein
VSCWWSNERTSVRKRMKRWLSGEETNESGCLSKAGPNAKTPERGRNDCRLVKEVSGTYFTSITQDTTKYKSAVDSYLPVQQKQVPVRLQDSRM